MGEDTRQDVCVRGKSRQSIEHAVVARSQPTHTRLLNYTSILVYDICIVGRTREKIDACMRECKKSSREFSESAKYHTSVVCHCKRTGISPCRGWRSGPFYISYWYDKLAFLKILQKNMLCVCVWSRRYILRRVHYYCKLPGMKYG